MSTGTPNLASTATGLLLIVIVGASVVSHFVKSVYDSRERSVGIERALGDIDAIELSQDPPALKNKRFLEIAYSNWDIANAVDAKHSQNYTLDRVFHHVQAGYNVTNPLDASIFIKAADATCMIRVRQVDEASANFLTDNYNAYLGAKNDLEAWRDYITEYDLTWRNCQHRFRVLQDRHIARLEREKAVSLREVGATVGKATTEVGNWWSNATKPISDAVSDFKEGYQSGK